MARVYVDVDVRGALRALKGMPKDASRELREASKKIVNDFIPRIAANAGTPQAKAAARSLRARSDRAPAIAIGGRQRVTSSKNGRAGSIFFGSEAGSVQFHQFPKPRKSYWFWDQIGKDSKLIMRQWGKAYERVIEKWAD